MSKYAKTEKVVKNLKMDNELVLTNHKFDKRKSIFTCHLHHFYQLILTKAKNTILLEENGNNDPHGYQ